MYPYFFDIGANKIQMENYTEIPINWRMRLQQKIKCEDESICQVNLLCQLKKELDLELN